jgi:hypothetical protein
MRIPKLLLTVCAMSICAGFISVHAGDTPAQAAARAALEQKMRELDLQPPQTNTAPATPQNETPPPQPAPSAGTVQTPAPAATAVSTPPTVSDTEAQHKAQAALEQKMHDLDAEDQTQGGPILINSSGVVAPEPASQPAPAMIPPATPAPVKAQAAKAPPADNSSLFEPATPTTPNSEAQSAADAALQQKMAELNQGQPAQFQPVPAAPPESSGATYPGKASEFEPMVAPPLPISPDKEAQLQALTAKYMANGISPEAYFKQREEILGKP